jgi:hypothetical protein
VAGFRLLLVSHISHELLPENAYFVMETAPLNRISGVLFLYSVVDRIVVVVCCLIGFVV